MATHKSAIKRNRQSNIQKSRNRSTKTYLKTRIKDVISAVESKNVEEAVSSLAQAIPVIDKAASKGVIHKRTAARKVSRLTRKINALRS
ncbi:MAG: 30S ribosomal protein S20 [Deltaproteobacteria bacterium]|nr:30S ribosomal protein S20 [Deltaproteobacteria bacterium]